MDIQTTSAIVFTDGYKGIAVADDSNTHKDVITFMSEESVWEVFDDLQTKPKGKYIATFDFWWESSFPDDGHELVINHDSMKFVMLADTDKT